jgi:hypothetical protein
MDPVSLLAGHQQKVDFAPTALLIGSGEKLGTDSWIGQPSCYGLHREPFFWEQWSYSTLLMTTQNVAMR